VVGFGFNSNGRYAPSGLLRERFIPRLLAAPADALVDGTGLIDPVRAWDAMMANEKPGGHGERSVAVGVLDMALWDAVAKAEGRAAVGAYSPTATATARADERAWVYGRRRLLLSRQGPLAALRTEMRSYRERGYRCVKMKIGGAPLDEDVRRIEAVLEIVGAGEKPRGSTSTAASGSTRRWPMRRRWRPTSCAGTRSRSTRSTTCCTRRSPRPIRGRSPPARTCSRCRMRATSCAMAASAPTATSCSSTRRSPTASSSTSAPSTCSGRHGWSARRCVPHGGHQFALNIAVGLGLGGNESYPDVFAPFGGFADGCPVEDGLVRLPGIPGIGFEGKANLWAVMKPLLEAA